MTERSLAEEWDAQADRRAPWTRTPGHDRHFHRYNWPSFLDLLPDPGRATSASDAAKGAPGWAG